MVNKVATVIKLQNPVIISISHIDVAICIKGKGAGCIKSPELFRLGPEPVKTVGQGAVNVIAMGADRLYGTLVVCGTEAQHLTAGKGNRAAVGGSRAAGFTKAVAGTGTTADSIAATEAYLLACRVGSHPGSDAGHRWNRAKGGGDAPVSRHGYRAGWIGTVTDTGPAVKKRPSGCGLKCDRIPIKKIKGTGAAVADLAGITFNSNATAVGADNGNGKGLCCCQRLQSREYCKRQNHPYRQEQSLHCHSSFKNCRIDIAKTTELKRKTL